MNYGWWIPRACSSSVLRWLTCVSKNKVFKRRQWMHIRMNEWMHIRNMHTRQPIKLHLGIEVSWYGFMTPGLVIEGGSPFTFRVPHLVLHGLRKANLRCSYSDTCNVMYLENKNTAVHSLMICFLQHSLDRKPLQLKHMSLCLQISLFHSLKLKLTRRSLLWEASHSLMNFYMYKNSHSYPPHSTGGCLREIHAHCILSLMLNVQLPQLAWWYMHAIWLQLSP